MTVTQVRLPSAPPITAPAGTLLDAATVKDGAEWYGAEVSALYDTFNCLKFQGEASFCAPTTKDLSGVAGWQYSFPIVAVGGVTCKAPGNDMARMKASVGEAFAAGESIALERAMLKTRFRVATTNNAAGNPVWAAPVDLTPTGGAVKPLLGVAYLESWARDNYIGVPTIHVPVIIGSLLMAPTPLIRTGRRLTTQLGSKVAVGGGYDYPNTGPTGAAAAAGEKWIYASGEVQVTRGELNVLQAFEQSNNEVTVMAERPYTATADCFTAAVRVQVTA